MAYAIGRITGYLIMGMLLAYGIVYIVARRRTGDPGAARERARSWRTGAIGLVMAGVLIVITASGDVAQTSRETEAAERLDVSDLFVPLPSGYTYLPPLGPDEPLLEAFREEDPVGVEARRVEADDQSETLVVVIERRPGELDLDSLARGFTESGGQELEAVTIAGKPARSGEVAGQTMLFSHLDVFIVMVIGERDHVQTISEALLGGYDSL
ncbi:MAG: hypothetical protein KY469_09680 [Actinobacteria bacterium]|nr:hypothetical protein [Actinomycetota bacterium]